MPAQPATEGIETAAATDADIFGFLTVNPNAEVGAIDPKATPVILQTPGEILCGWTVTRQAIS